MVRLPLDELESLGASDTVGRGLVHEGLPLHSTGSPSSQSSSLRLPSSEPGQRGAEAGGQPPPRTHLLMQSSLLL